MSNSKRPKRPVPVKRQGMPNGQKAIVIGIVLLCVAALIAIPLLLNSGGDDDESASAASSKPSPTSVDDVTCDKAPEGQSEGKTYPSPPPGQPVGEHHLGGHHPHDVRRHPGGARRQGGAADRGVVHLPCT